MNLEEMKVQFDAIRKDVLATLEEVTNLKELDQIRVQQLGKKDPSRKFLKTLKTYLTKRNQKWGLLPMNYVLY